MNTKKYDFVAVDFENADDDQYACQVGIVAVADDQIVEEIEYLIQPPNNRYGKWQKNIHKITEEHTMNAPTFDIIWDKIEPYLVNQTLVMHNASTDKAILNKSLMYYLIPLPDLEIIDTNFEICQCKLKILAQSFDIEIDNYHNALNDARATALIWLKFCKGYKPDLKYIEEQKGNEVRKKINFEHKRIDNHLFIKDLNNVKDKDNPFFDRRVVITGDFEIHRKELAKKLKSMGADINSSISKQTNFVIIGKNPGPSKMNTIEKLKQNGFNITLIYEDDLHDILFNNNYENYYTEKEPTKELKITLEHLNETNKFDIVIDKIDLFSRKEFFVGDGFKGERTRLCQLIGYLGAFSNSDIDNTTDIILISDKTFNNLLNGEFDSNIDKIEQTYNQQKAVNFKFKFIIEKDFMDYYSNRMNTSHKGDTAVEEIYHKYISTEEINIMEMR